MTIGKTIWKINEFITSLWYLVIGFAGAIVIVDLMPSFSHSPIKSISLFFGVMIAWFGGLIKAFYSLIIDNKGEEKENE